MTDLRTSPYCEECKQRLAIVEGKMVCVNSLCPESDPMNVMLLTIAELRNKLSATERELDNLNMEWGRRYLASQQADKDRSALLVQINELTEALSAVQGECIGAHDTLDKLGIERCFPAGHPSEGMEYALRYRIELLAVQLTDTKAESALLVAQLAEVKDLADKWKSGYEMYMHAWVRETNGITRQAKTHLIDELVLLTRDLRKKASRVEAAENELSDTRSWAMDYCGVFPSDDLKEGLLRFVRMRERQLNEAEKRVTELENKLNLTMSNKDRK